MSKDLNFCPELGKLVEGNARRDAVHVAVAPVVAGCPIKPGHHVALNAVGEAVWGNPEDGETVGIADPFLREEIKRGQRFWLCLYPNTVTSLRHVWTHPAFSTQPNTTYPNPGRKEAPREPA